VSFFFLFFFFIGSFPMRTPLRQKFKASVLMQCLFWLNPKWKQSGKKENGFLPSFPHSSSFCSSLSFSQWT
jgi:hypothetical protein